MKKIDGPALAPEETKQDTLRREILSLTDEQADWAIEVFECLLAARN